MLGLVLVGTNKFVQTNRLIGKNELLGKTELFGLKDLFGQWKGSLIAVCPIAPLL